MRIVARLIALMLDLHVKVGCQMPMREAGGRKCWYRWEYATLPAFKSMQGPVPRAPLTSRATKSSCMIRNPRTQNTKPHALSKEHPLARENVMALSIAPSLPREISLWRGNRRLTQTSPGQCERRIEEEERRKRLRDEYGFECSCERYGRQICADSGVLFSCISSHRRLKSQVPP